VRGSPETEILHAAPADSMAALTTDPNGTVNALPLIQTLTVARSDMRDLHRSRALGQVGRWIDR
jgi:hypothetical protein